jgi:hypothetical protein
MEWGTETLRRSFFEEFCEIFEGNDAVGDFLAVNRIAGLEKIKQTVFFNFWRVGWAKPKNSARPPNGLETDRWAA